MQGSMLLLTANWLFLTTQKLCAAVSFGSTPCGDPFWTFSIWEQVAESSPFQRVASNPGEPCAKKAKTASALDLPHGICEELTASLKIALWEGERATKPSNAELCAKTASPAPSCACSTQGQAGAGGVLPQHQPKCGSF